MNMTKLLISTTLAALYLTVHALSQTNEAAPAASPPLVGTVIETMDAGGYTYLLVQHAARKSWVAAKQFKVAVGDQVKVADGWMMKDFESRTLKRKFDWILFAPTVEVNGQAGHLSPPSLPPGHPPLSPATPAAPSSPVEVKPGAVEKVPGGYTVAECYSQKKKLEGQTIQIRGVVIKFLPDILGRNWVHLRDGTGAAATSDLTVTTAATAKPGDTIVVRGRLVCDKDFGAGYKYAILLEDAVITDTKTEVTQP